MAIYSETLTMEGQATVGRQFSGLIVVGVHGLSNGTASLQVSPDNSVWYDVRVITDDGEKTYDVPGEGGQDYYRVLILSKPRSGDVVVRLGNNDGSGVGGELVQISDYPVLVVTNAIDQTGFDLQASAFSATSNISNDYILDSIKLNFSTAEQKTITVTGPDGTVLYEDTNSNRSVALVDVNTGFNGGENFTVQVTQFSSAGTCDCVAVVREGSSTTLSGSPVLGAGVESIGTVGLDAGSNYVGQVGIQFADGPLVDAFDRLRVSNPSTIFDSKQIFDNQALFWDDQEVSGSGTGSVYSQDEAATTMSVSASTAGKRVRQTFRRFNYEPGKSQLVLLTAVLNTGALSGVTACVGVFDDNNGIFLSADDGVVNAVIRSSVTGTPVDNVVPQSSWNVDRLDGTGPSGKTLDPTKTNIIVIDYEWLGVGRVRVGFVFDGVITYCHYFNHAGILSDVYMSTPNLPLRYEIENDGTGGAVSLKHICSTVITEGGSQSLGLILSNGTRELEIDANTSGTFYALCGIRLKTTALGATVDIEKMLAVLDTNDLAYWELRWNPSVAGTFTYSDVANSVVQFAVGDTSTNPSTNTVTGGVVLAAGYISSQGREANIKIDNALKLGAAIDGTRDEMVLCVTPFTGDSGLDIGGGLIWRELK